LSALICVLCAFVSGVAGYASSQLYADALVDSVVAQGEAAEQGFLIGISLTMIAALAIGASVIMAYIIPAWRCFTTVRHLKQQRAAFERA
jgi:hypothetical protein